MFLLVSLPRLLFLRWEKSEHYGLVITQNSHAKKISACEPLLISTLTLAYVRRSHIARPVQNVSQDEVS